MDLTDALIRSMAAIDRSRNKQQATVLLNYRSRKLLAQAKFAQKQSQRTRQTMRAACDKLVSSSFSTLARTGDLLQRWASTPELTENIELPVQGVEKQPDGESSPGQRHKVQKAGQGADHARKIELYG